MTFILLDNTKDRDEGAWLFEDPLELIRADAPEEVLAAFEKLENAHKRELYAAGFCAFELAYVLEPSLTPYLPQNRNVPLLWFGVFKTRERLSADQATAYLKNKAGQGIHIPTLVPEWSQDDYTQRFEKAREAISAGEIYQLNLTFKTTFECKRDPVNLYLRLREQQPVAYGAYLDAPDFKVLSLSPELFIKKSGSHIETRPMKGTAPRAPLPELDKVVAHTLATEPKSQAENLMIVDLMRNDVGRISQTGSVAVHNLYAVETYKTLHQMISTVSATLKPNINCMDLFKALFAPGSVVGAPKIQAMKKIRALETSPRGIYCGAIGMMGQGEAVFNVAIRTAVLFPKDDQAYAGEMGIGSGVVYDSSATSEYQECLLKTKFFQHHIKPEGLIETLRYDKKGGFYLLDLHMQRMAASAAYYEIPFNRDKVIKALNEFVADIVDDHTRCRLVLLSSGGINLTAQALPAGALTQTIHFVYAPEIMQSNNPYLYHKTTTRDFLDAPCARLKKSTCCDEVVYLNERGEVTQGSYMNIFLEQADGTFVTPPITAGLLPGVFRAEFIAKNHVIEKTVFPDDLKTAKQVYLGNSVRGLLKAKLVS
ncbi:MAG: aminodeoxychorismate synthase component I [Alphaproteobacteria bacterium]|nr:aminodeoxychorismate synthase component I [Alphaproteobacteria bacterium]